MRTTKLTLKAWAKELGEDPATLAKRFRLAGFEVRPKATWTGRQLALALRSDSLLGERIRETRARADLLETKVAELRATLVPMDLARAVLQRVLRDLLVELRDAPNAVAHRANPGDPDHARRVMAEHFGQIMTSARAGFAKVGGR